MFVRGGILVLGFLILPGVTHEDPFYWLVNPSLSNALRSFSISLPWKVKIPKMAKFFCLTARVNTMDRFMERASLLICLQCCTFCKGAVVDLDHFLWSCDYASTLWFCLFKVFGISVAQT